MKGEQMLGDELSRTEWHDPQPVALTEKDVRRIVREELEAWSAGQVYIDVADLIREPVPAQEPHDVA